MKSFLNFFLYVFICSCTTSYTTFSFDFIKWQQQCVYCNSPPYRCLAINYQPAMGGVLRTPTGSILASLGYGCFLSEFNTVQPGNATIVEVTPTKQKVWEMHFAPGVLPAPQPALAFIRAKPSRSSCVFAFSDLHLQALPLLNMCDIFVGCFVWRRWCLTPPNTPKLPNPWQQNPIEAAPEKRQKTQKKIDCRRPFAINTTLFYKFCPFSEFTSLLC